jgi:ABC-type polysaccharide/polyol phosphate transport system ATPase subunit
VSATVGEPSSTPASASSPGVADAGTGAPTAISLEHVSKSFRMPTERYHTLKERVLHPRRWRQFKVLQAVDDVSLEIAEGEFFGIVGRNGSGKSTLLKCLAGIYDTDGGSIAIDGKLSPFIELGVGFNPELTARDNAIINAIMLGLSRREAEARLEQVIAFAELEEFVEMKLKNFSSGMQVRLAFSVAIQVDADILLIDEVLAVGDASFQQKCFDEFARLKREGRTIVFVTHDMGAIQRYCDRAMLLERGRIVDLGQPAVIARKYNELNFRRVRLEAMGSQAGPEAPRREPEAEIVSAVFESAAGEPLMTVKQGEPCCVRMEIRFHKPIDDPVFAIALYDDAERMAFGTSTLSQGMDMGHWDAGVAAAVLVRFENWLGHGRYRLMATVARGGSGLELLDLMGDRSLLVIAEKPGGGVVDLPHSFEIDRAPQA